MPNVLQAENFVLLTAETPAAEAETSQDGATQNGAVQDRAVRPDDLEMLGAGQEFLATLGFKAKLAETAVLPAPEGVVVGVGLGEDDLTEADLRKLAAAVFRASQRMASLATSLAVATAEDLGSATALKAVIEGMMLASYRFDELKGSASDATEDDGSTANDSAPINLSQIFVTVPPDLDVAAAQDALQQAVALANGIALARDLVNRPAGSLTATQLAEAAEQAMPADAPAGAGVTVEIWDKEKLIQERCGGLLGVNAGSTEEPRLVQMKYSPASEPVAEIFLIGKGITFDTGGLNLKSFEGMKSMKTDMGGAAAVIGAMSAIARLAPDTTVVGICCCTDNQPGPTATKPGDVLHIRNGKTVEVLNTDAEGRLVLADGLSIAAEAKPRLIVDLATLTGACVVALGPKYAGLMSNNDAAAELVLDAAAAANERVWHLPLPEEYRQQLDSEVADLRNIGKGAYGGALTAGLFLQEFVDSNDWVHLDVAGPVSTDQVEAEFVKGATGFGVRTLVKLVCETAALKGD